MSITKFNNIACYWYQNIQQQVVEPLILINSYDPLLYPAYDNYEAIEVSRVNDIPKDYTGLMGVPVTFLSKHNPKQFEIVGLLNHGSDSPFDFVKPIINGKEIFKRLLIRRKDDY